MQVSLTNISAFSRTRMSNYSLRVWILGVVICSYFSVRFTPSVGQSQDSFCLCSRRKSSQLCLHLIEQDESSSTCEYRPCLKYLQCDLDGPQCCRVDELPIPNLVSLSSEKPQVGDRVPCAYVDRVLHDLSVPFPSQVYQRRYSPEDPAENDGFGHAVAIWGNMALVGARYKNQRAGRAYMFEVDTGRQTAELAPEMLRPEDRFGFAVALNDKFALVGTRNMQALGSPIFVYDPYNATLLRLLTSDHPQNGSTLGADLSLLDDLVLAGDAFWDGPDAAHNMGAAYLYNVSTGMQLLLLTASDGMQGDRFGHATALGGQYGLVGAIDDDGSRGSVYVFDIPTGQEIRKLTAPDASPRALFGYSISLGGESDLALIGSPQQDDRHGSAYLFNLTSGQPLLTFRAKDTKADSLFGDSVQLNVAQGIALITASGHFDDCRGPNTGAAYVFDSETGKELVRLAAQDGHSGDGFGWSSSLYGNQALIGATWTDQTGNDSGSAYLYNVSKEFISGRFFWLENQ